MNTRCPRCDTAFECTPEGRCWCMDLPPLPITGDISRLSCLCRRCLEERVRECEAELRQRPSATNKANGAD